MNSLGWWIASVFFAVAGMVWLTMWAFAIAMTQRIDGEPRWKRPLAAGLIPVVLIAWFLLIAYGASHMFDPVPVSYQTPSVTAPR